MENVYENGAEFYSWTPESCVHYPPPDYILKGVLASGEIGCIFGAPGAGKSLLALYMAYRISQGVDISGMKARKNKVLYLPFEDVEGIFRRVVALKSMYGPAENLSLIDNVGNLYVDNDEYYFYIERLVRHLRSNKISLVIIDTLSAAFYGLEENDNKSMNRVVERAKYIARESGAAVILVHHNTKSDGSTPRGHGVLLGALDMALQVRQLVAGKIEAKFTKIKNGSTERRLQFGIHVENIGVDFDDDPVTAAVCIEADIGNEEAACSKAELAALKVLDELSQSGEVSQRDWLSACTAGKCVSAASQAADRQRVCRRVLHNLKNQSVIQVLDGFVSRSPA